MIYLFAVLLIIYVFCCLVLVGFILTQEGKGGGLSGVMGASMGETFGFGGATTTIRKFTSIAATVFMVLTVVLTFVGERVVTNASSEFLSGDGAAAVPGTPSGPGTVAPVPAGSAPTVGGAQPQVIQVQPDAASAAPAAAPATQSAPAATEAAPATQSAPAATEVAPAPADATAQTAPAASTEAVPAASAPAEQPVPAETAPAVAPQPASTE